MKRFRLQVAWMALWALSGSALADLRPMTSNHYRIQTDVDPFLAEDLSRRMDAMYDEYARRLIEFSPADSNRLFDVYIFNRHDSYLAYTHRLYPNTGGVFISGKALAAYLEGQGRDQLRRILQHEAFHQFAWNAIGTKVPVWLNEGLAQIFEEGIYNGQEFRIGNIPPRRVRQLQHDIQNRKLFDFQGFLSMTDKQWAENLADRERGSIEYNQAWAMAHFLIFAEESPGKPRFRARLIEMLRLIHDGKNGNDAFTEAFSSNIAGFQKMFLDYARSLHATPLATFIENQDVLADLLIELKSRGKTFTDMADFRREIERGQFQIEYTRGAIKWSSEQNPAVYFRDLTGASLSGESLYFVQRNGTPLPDIITRPAPHMQLRTRFFQSGAKIEHETVVEAMK